MKKIVLTILISLSFAQNILEKKILSIEDELIILNANDLKVGMAGLVIEEISKDINPAMKYVEIINISKNKAYAKIIDKEINPQDAMPSIKFKLNKDNKILFKVFYNRVLLISPNQEDYIKFTKNNKNLSFIHPDLLSYILTINGHLSPSKDDFKEFCTTNYTGLIKILANKKIYDIDCISFKVIKEKIYILTSKKIMKPFYLRVKKINANFFGEGSEEIEDYNKYYENLIKN